jgi:beta-1,4-mannosyl-glycoprotein beta-1,4-N-acetylglucosaminyltransferase
MIYDCFTFFNELDLLEIRLNELNDVVDKFVVVECTKTHSYKDKPLYYNENKDRYTKFHDKIIHVIVDDAPDITKGIKNPDRWIVEKFQRNCIERGLAECKDDDIVLVSDVDEIPRPVDIPRAAAILDHYPDRLKMITFRQRMFYYFLNGLCVHDNGSNEAHRWDGTIGCYYKDFPGADQLRLSRQSEKSGVINDSGWHFSYLGGIDKITKKLESFAHSEFDNAINRDKERIKDVVDKGLDIFSRPNKPGVKYLIIQDNEYWPRHIRENIEKFSHLIKEPATGYMSDFPTIESNDLGPPQKI